MEITTLKRTCIQRKIRTNRKCFQSDQSSVRTEKKPRMGNQLPHVLAFKNKGYPLKNI